MAFQAPNSGQGKPTIGQQVNIDIENANRKILQQLEEEKKRLRMQAAITPNAKPINSGSITSAPLPVSGPPVSSTVQQQAPGAMPQMMTGLENQQMTPAQRTALQHAHANSVGYFITQDSSFGNLILPVLPRFDR